MHRTPTSVCALALFCCLVAATTHAQTTTVTKTVYLNVWNNTPTSCSYIGSPVTLQFADIAGPDWTKLEIRAHMAYFQFKPPPTVTMLINNEVVGQPQAIVHRTLSFCDGRGLYVYTSGKLPNYNAFGMNTLTVVSDGGEAGGGNPVELIFTIPAPSFTFDLGPNESTRMLTHNYSPQGTLPRFQMSQAANGRPRFRFSGAVKADGVGAARDIWFRVIDPPDSARYGSPVANDNQDPQPKGVLSTPGCATTTCRAGGGAPLRTRSDATGAVAVDLEGTGRYGGDNYRLEASFDATFTCATAGPNGSNICPRSGLVTAWKRINVEMHKMFKNGAFLTEDVTPGDLVIRVNDVSVFPDPPFVVRLIHGADADGGSPNDFYSEEVVVRHLRGRRLFNASPAKGELHLRAPGAPGVGDTIQNPYDTLENVLGTDRPYLADAVGLSTTGSDYMAVDTSLVAPLFDDAYVEFLWLTDESGYAWTDPRYERVLPHIDRVGQGDRTMTELLARKWMRNAQRIGVWRVAAPNHQMVFLASRLYDPDPATISRGITRVSHAFNDLWLFTSATPDPDLRAEALTHELGHQWLVNQVYRDGRPTTIADYPGGHCDRAFGAQQYMAIASNSALLCEMTSGDNLWTASEARDRRVGFHYVVLPGQQIDSEYVHIRRRAEPVPQNDNPRPRIITQ